MDKAERDSSPCSRWLVLIAAAMLVSACSTGGDSENITGERANGTDNADQPNGYAAAVAGSGSSDIFPSNGVTIEGNKVELLIDGPDTYDAMFEAISRATDHINLETFILADDLIGQRLSDALAKKAAAGVVVNVIYDAIGSMSTDDEYFELLRKGGINLLAYDPPMETEPTDWHNRNHRKVLIVDGKIGFTGGLNFTNEYRFSSDSASTHSRFEEGWRDTHLMIEGPAVAAMQEAFFALWHDNAEDQPLASANYFPELARSGSQDVIVVATNGDDEWGSNVIAFYERAIEAAKDRIWITQAYFAPTDEFVDSLEAAARRGVDVRILLPRYSDVEIAELAGRAHYADLLDAGVRIFEYETSVLHAKTALVDDDWSTIGSSNLDLLSMEFNNELNAIVLDSRFAQDMAQTFLKDLERADEIARAEWDERSVWTKAKHAGAKLIQGGD